MFFFNLLILLRYRAPDIRGLKFIARYGDMRNVWTICAIPLYHEISDGKVVLLGYVNLHFEKLDKVIVLSWER